MPAWAVRAAAWPVLMHPGVAISAVALDAAASYGNFTQAAASLIAASSERVRATEVNDDDTGLMAANQAVGLFLFWGLIFTVVFLVQFGGECSAACLHKAFVNNRRPEFPEEDELSDELSMAEEPHDFHSSPIRCCGPSEFLYALACPAVRHADTLDAAGVLGYWKTFAAFLFIEAAFGYGFAFEEQWTRALSQGQGFVGVEVEAALLRGLVLALVFVPARRALRAKFASPQPGSWPKDVAWWTFCSWCMVAQEGAEVDAAGGVALGCPCLLTDLKTGELVGAPVGEAGDDVDN